MLTIFLIIIVAILGGLVLWLMLKLRSVEESLRLEYEELMRNQTSVHKIAIKILERRCEVADLELHRANAVLEMAVNDTLVVEDFRSTRDTARDLLETNTDIHKET